MGRTAILRLSYKIETGTPPKNANAETCPSRKACDHEIIPADNLIGWDVEDRSELPVTRSRNGPQIINLIAGEPWVRLAEMKERFGVDF